MAVFDVVIEERQHSFVSQSPDKSINVRTSVWLAKEGV